MVDCYHRLISGLSLADPDGGGRCHDFFSKIKLAQL